MRMIGLCLPHCSAVSLRTLGETLCIVPTAAASAPIGAGYRKVKMASNKAVVYAMWLSCQTLTESFQMTLILLCHKS